MNDADRKAFEDWKVSTPEMKYKFENGSLLQEMIAGEAWQACCEWRDSQVGQPVAYLCEIDVQNFQGQSEFRTALFYRKDPAWHEGNLINEVISAKPLYTTPPAAQINQQLVEALEELLEYTGFTGTCSEKAQAALAAAKGVKNDN